LSPRSFSQRFFRENVPQVLAFELLLGDVERLRRRTGPDRGARFVRDLCGEVTGLDLAVIGHDRGVLDRVSQLADVAGKAEGRERAPGGR
jgi:hypothetical protein